MADETREQRIKAALSVFAKDVGVWDAEISITPGPGATAIVQKGVSESRLIAGGRWLVTDYKAETHFEGHGIYGWDDHKQVYVGAWVDSAQGSIARSEGTWDAAARIMTFVTEASHQGKVMRYREITETVADGHQLYRNLVPAPDGSEFEMIRATYRRRS